MVGLKYNNMVKYTMNVIVIFKTLIFNFISKKYSAVRIEKKKCFIKKISGIKIAPLKLDYGGILEN